MRFQKIVYIFLCVVLAISFVGCQKESVNYNNEMQIYFFDASKNELVGEVLPLEFTKLLSEQEKVEYIISRLKENKTTLLTSLQLGPKMPIENDTTSINTKERVVKVDFTSEYNELTPQQKIGMRASIVYSLTELEFIDGVDFYVEQTPLSTATGKLVGVVYRSDINKDALVPSPATKPYVLNVYFANKEGKLQKEMHSIIVSNSSKEEKLVIEEIIQGPKSDELLPTVPKNTKVNTVDTLNGVCQIDLSFDPKDKFFKDDYTRTLMIYSIVNSLTELPQVKKVIISIDGQEEVAFTSDIDLPKTFERSERYISQENSTT